MGRGKQCRIKMAGRQNVNVDYLKHTLILSNYRGVPPIKSLPFSDFTGAFFWYFKRMDNVDLLPINPANC